MSDRPSIALLALALCGVTPAAAQIKPQTSGSLAHREPEMKKHGSGLTRPNMPRHRRDRTSR